MPHDDSIKRRLPDMSGSTKYHISDGEIEKIKAQLFSSPKACDWCGFSDMWEVDGNVFTDVTFDIVDDHHVNTKVHALIVVHCKNCGNTKRFCMKHFGLTTKGGLKND